MRRKLAILVTGILVSLGVSDACQASLVVTWTDDGTNVSVSVDGDWSEWNGVTAPTQTDSLTFVGSAFELSRGNSFSTTGAFAFIDLTGGTGSITGPTVNFGPPLPTTGYFLRTLGSNLVLEADTPTSGTFTINETLDLGDNSMFTLTPGTRTFLKDAGGTETLTMNYVSAATSVPEPSSMALLGLGSMAFAYSRRRRSKKAALPIAEQVLAHDALYSA